MPERHVLVVTGASSGIGREVAREAARRGFAVVAVARRKERLDELTGEIAKEGGVCEPVALDVLAADAPKRIVAAALARFGRIDVLVNNAGAATPGTLLEQSDAQIDEQWQLHVAAPLRITREALCALKMSGGQVFFLGSGLARVPAPGYGAYCAAKAAVRAASIQLRRELRGSGIAVTYVDPGSVQTEFGEAAGLQGYTPDGLSVKPEVVAKRIVRAIRSRPSRVNAVPWQTAAVVLGEWFPRFTDRALARAEHAPLPQAPPPQPAQPAAPAQPPQAAIEEPAAQTDFERALAPVARRLERVKLPPVFLAELLRPGEDVQLTDAAMRWAGMPNKNERAAMAEALEALAAGGFLERTGEETWRVVRAAE